MARTVGAMFTAGKDQAEAAFRVALELNENAARRFYTFARGEGKTQVREDVDHMLV